MKMKRLSPRKPRKVWDIDPVSRIHGKSGYDRASSKKELRSEIEDNMQVR